MIDLGRYLIETPMQQQCINTLTLWVRLGATGGLIYGDARLGKTYAMRHLRGRLKTPSGETIASSLVQMMERDHPTIRSVAYQLARELCDCQISKRASGDELLDMVCTSLADQATLNSDRRVVLLIDEVQELSVRQLKVFAQIFNKLDMAHFRLSIFFIANAQAFTPTYQQLTERQNQYLMDRFFKKKRKFHGIQSEADLKACLDQYDAIRVQSANNRFLVDAVCPKMAKSGAKFAEMASVMWRIYNELNTRPHRQESWGMSHFVETMSVMVNFYLKYWAPGEPSMERVVRKSLVEAGVADWQLSSNNTKDEKNEHGPVVS